MDKAISLLDRTAEEYRKLYEDDLANQTPQHSWLGLHDQISKALTQLKDCLSGQRAVPPTLL